MYEKQAFFKMQPSDQKRLRSFMILLSSVQIIIAITASSSMISLMIGVVANLLIIYASIFIIRAPNFYFQLFFWIFIMDIIFGGWEIYDVLSGQQLFTFQTILVISTLGLVLIFAPLIFKHRRYASEVKKGLVI